MISIVVVSHDRPNHLADCLASIRNQSYQGHVDIVVSDDGGNKDNRIIADNFKARFVTAEHSENLGRVLNRGIAATKYDDLVLLSEDMVLWPGYLNIASARECFQERMIVYGSVNNTLDKKFVNTRHHHQIPNYTDIVILGMFNLLDLDLNPDDLIKLGWWSIADTLDTILKKSTLKSEPISEEFDMMPTHVYPEWLFRLWIRRFTFRFCPELEMDHQNHKALTEGGEKYQKSLSIYKKNLEQVWATYKPSAKELRGKMNI